MRARVDSAFDDNLSAADQYRRMLKAVACTDDFELMLHWQLKNRNINDAIKAYYLLQDERSQLLRVRLFDNDADLSEYQRLLALRILYRLRYMAEKQDIPVDEYFYIPDAETVRKRHMDIELAYRKEIEFAGNVILGLDHRHKLKQLGRSINKLPQDVIETAIGSCYKTAITGQTAAWQLGFSDKWLLNVATPVSFGFGIGAALFSALNTMIVPAVYLYYKYQGHDISVSGMTKAKVAASAGITILTIIGLAFPPAAAAVLIGFGAVSFISNGLEMLDHGLQRQRHPRLVRESAERLEVLSHDIELVDQQIDQKHRELCEMFRSDEPQIAIEEQIKNDLVELRARMLTLEQAQTNERKAHRELQKNTRITRSNLQTTMTAIDVAVGVAILVGSLLAAFPLTAPAGVLCVTVAVGVGVGTFIARKIQQAWAHRKNRNEEAAEEAVARNEASSSLSIYKRLDSVPDLRRVTSYDSDLFDDTQSESRPLLRESFTYLDGSSESFSEQGSNDLEDQPVVNKLH